MVRFFYHFIFFCLIVITFGICRRYNDNPLICTICLQPLIKEYSIDAWQNPFHTHHENDGVFCNSCSRIISHGITHGGFRYKDGRHLCSLCQISVVENDSVIQVAYASVHSQLESVGIRNIPLDIPIKLINLIKLTEKFGIQSHGNLKGFTYQAHEHTSDLSYTIFMLFGLPRIEFEAVLAHELLHVWLYQNNITLSLASTEGFCNLGSYLIYKNDNTHFSRIHINAMATSKDKIYGKGFRKMKNQLEKLGWKKFIANLPN